MKSAVPLTLTKLLLSQSSAGFLHQGCALSPPPSPSLLSLSLSLLPPYSNLRLCLSFSRLTAYQAILLPLANCRLLWRCAINNNNMYSCLYNISLCSSAGHFVFVALYLPAVFELWENFLCSNLYDVDPIIRT